MATPATAAGMSQLGIAVAGCTPPGSPSATLAALLVLEDAGAIMLPNELKMLERPELFELELFELDASEPDP